MTVTVPWWRAKLDRCPASGRMPGSVDAREGAPAIFTAPYKLDVVAEYDAVAAGEKGAVLRREGLYSSHVIEWRQARVPSGLAAGPAGG
jgi:transposase